MATASPKTNTYLYDATGNGHFVVNGVAQAANTEYRRQCGELCRQVSFMLFGATGSAPDFLLATGANDGSLWVGRVRVRPFTGSTPGPDAAPVVHASSVLLRRMASYLLLASSLFTTTDADGP